jgi:hypothetical protein
MGDNPAGNGGQRFADLMRAVERIDGKVDVHGERLARIEAHLDHRPCAVHDNLLRKLESRQERIEGEVQSVEEQTQRRHEENLGTKEFQANVSVAKIAGLSTVISAAVSAIGLWFSNKGGP